MRTTLFVLLNTCLIAAASVHAQTTQPAKLPNVLIILSDDHSGAHLGCYGNPDVRTPNLDRLAADGVRFDRAYVTAPQCVPSRASILTGRHPIDIGMTRFSAALPQDVQMFPERLRAQRSYFAGLCGRGYHLDGRGHDHPLIKPHLNAQDRPNVAQRLDYVRMALEGLPRRADTIAQLEEFLALAPLDRPFFLQLSWGDPHRPFTDEELPYRHDPASITLPPFYPDAPPLRNMLARYYDEIGRMDADTGRVLAILEKSGRTADTIVIFTGDNGASQLRGKGTLNEFGIRVPLIVRWPGVVKPNSSSAQLVSGEDLAPTLLAAAGLKADVNCTGTSFLPLLRGDAGAEPRRTSVVCARGPHGSGPPRGSNSFDLGRAIVTERYKLIYNVTWQLPYQPIDFNLNDIKALQADGKLDKKLADLYLSPQRQMFELYDLQTDPHEMTNLAGRPEAKDIEQDLKGRLAAWQIHHRDFVPLPMSLGRPAARRNAVTQPAAED